MVKNGERLCGGDSGGRDAVWAQRTGGADIAFSVALTRRWWWHCCAPLAFAPSVSQCCRLLTRPCGAISCNGWRLCAHGAGANTATGCCRQANAKRRKEKKHSLCDSPSTPYLSAVSTFRHRHFGLAFGRVVQTVLHHRRWAILLFLV